MSFDHLEQVRPVLRPRLAVDRLYRREKGFVLARRERDDLAALGGDGAARVLLLADVQIALEDDRRLHCLLHGRPEIGGPSLEGAAIEKNRPRDVEMV